MKVYIAEAHLDFEGFVILGVFATREGAEQRILDDRRGVQMPTTRYEITEHEVAS